MEPGIYTHLSGDEYHAAPGISNSGLSIIATRTPAHYKYRQDKDTEAKKAGRRLHFSLLEPDEYERLYVPADKFDLRTNVGKAAKKAWEEANAGKLPINPEERDQALRIRDKLHADPDVRELLLGGHKERSVFARDPVTGALVKCRPDNDKVITGVRVLPDLKSTESADPEDFEWSGYRYGYFRQAAFYMDVCGWEGSEPPPEEFYFIAFEKEPPYAYIIYKAAPRFLSRGRDSYRPALNTYAQCQESGIWPDYERGIHSLDLPEAIHKRMDAADNDLVESISYVR